MWGLHPLWRTGKSISRRFIECDGIFWTYCESYASHCMTDRYIPDGPRRPRPERPFSGTSYPRPYQPSFMLNQELHINCTHPGTKECNATSR
jgi:hypothetical protein